MERVPRWRWEITLISVSWVWSQGLERDLEREERIKGRKRGLEGERERGREKDE